VEDDLRKLGVKRWRTKVLDRVEWASIIREAKAKLKGPERYRKKKQKKNNTAEMIETEITWKFLLR
jgi:BRCT domain type II-containing protein